VTPRAEMAATLGALAVGALVALVAAGQPRVSTGHAGEQITGADTPAAAALGLVVLAGAAAVLLVRGRARRLIGALMLVAAAGIVAVNLTTPDSIAFSAFAPSTGADTAQRSLWAWLGTAGGVMAAVGSLAVAVRAGRWPGPRRTYESTPRPVATGTDPWTALDRGEDPTR
jgi:hypothetical protein